MKGRWDGAVWAAVAVESYGKAVGLIADLLDQMEDRRMMFQADRLILLPEDVDDFLLLGDTGDSLVDDFEFFQRRGGRVELAESAVDQDEAGEGLLFLL